MRCGPWDSRFLNQSNFLSACDAGAPVTAQPDPLAVQLSQLARDLEQQDTPQQTLDNIVRAAVALIPGAEQGSISVVRRRQEVHSEAASGELPRLVDSLQHELGQGPCLDAVFEQQTVHVPDMHTEQRWPRFSSRAFDAGTGSMLAFQLYVDGDSLGALNLYSTSARSFDEESEHIGLLFASHAAVAYAAAVKQSGLVRAVETRQRIGQAQGILMERHKLTEDQAFACIVAASQRTNVKLRDVADQLVETGELPN